MQMRGIDHRHMHHEMLFAFRGGIVHLRCHFNVPRSPEQQKLANQIKTGEA